MNRAASAGRGGMGLLLAIGLLLVRPERTPAVVGLPGTVCYGDIGASPYAGGLSAGHFSAFSAARFEGGAVKLDTALAPLNPQRIVLPFDQEVRVKFVYRNAGASHTLGWFYFDQIQAFLDRPATDPAAQLRDQDGDGIPDFWQSQSGSSRPQMGLFKISSGHTAPDLVRSTTSPAYSDGGIYARVPNLLETLTGPGKGGMIFLLCDDDTNLTAYNALPPVGDSSTTSDGIPDYDVNGDGAVGNEADRTVNLGIIKGNREIVFFAVTYYGQTFRDRSLGLPGSGTRTGYIMPWFTKNLLNPDSGSRTPGEVLRRQAIGCARDDSACYLPRGATLGWMDASAITRLNTPTYNNIVLDDTVNSVVVGADGSVPHFVVNAPRTDPNRWLLAFEDLPAYSASDFDYNDVVFLVERSNGGSIESNLVSTEIPPERLGSTVISRVRLAYTASYPSPGCEGVAGAEIRISYSVNGKQSWRQVFSGRQTAGDLTIDVLSAGDVGNQLYWKAEFVSPVELCQPRLDTMRVGYEAIEHGEFKFAAPIPIANMVFTGSLETPPFPAPAPPPTNNDLSLRGHFRAVRLYDPQNPSATTLNEVWDAGVRLAQRDPDTRMLLTETGATSTLVETPFTRANAAALFDLLIPPADRTALMNGRKVYDFTGDDKVDVNDAIFLIEWTRGFEVPPGLTLTPARAVEQRAWKLGAVHRSSPAIVGPSPRPSWANGTGVPSAMKSAHEAFRTATAARPTLALVGAQDGMLHAFDAGRLRYGNDAGCGVQLMRGCFAGGDDATRYGSGDERWAFVPPTQLGRLRNNHPRVAEYNLAQNPRAEVDGALNVEDIFVPDGSGSGTFKTVAFAAMGRRQPYITAVEVTGSGGAAPLWATEWSDADFAGMELSPSVGLAKIGGAARFILVVTSGLGTGPRDLYLYLIDPLSGATLSSPPGKIKLNTGANAAQALGIAGYPKLVDSDEDGLLDRVYAVDTLGRLFKHDLLSGQTCRIASLGESVFTSPAVQAGGAGQPVSLFLGGGPNPDGSGAVLSGYHLFGLRDEDAPGTCREGGAVQIYKTSAGAGQKVWATPVLSSTDVFFATAGTSSLSVCGSSEGRLTSLSLTGDGTAPARSNLSSAPVLSGSPAQSLKIYDQHVLINSVGGETVVHTAGASGWNNPLPALGGSGGSPTLDTLLWMQR